ncbi:CAP domain-containing protein [Periweissella cryptocerci]|uniref:CAP domain-containing protein n=1 Tax=Periweissella cryptocerci TaxID=2506420 RepID=A0A4P6YT88_9LACO|nr:CAP domain-containing protein [Periweissella cryptocerci]QBO35882.1 CAP domain-containing protein [Periweissella cryptocerci]
MAKISKKNVIVISLLGTLVLVLGLMGFLAEEARAGWRTSQLVQSTIMTKEGMHVTNSNGYMYQINKDNRYDVAIDQGSKLHSYTASKFYTSKKITIANPVGVNQWSYESYYVITNAYNQELGHMKASDVAEQTYDQVPTQKRVEQAALKYINRLRKLNHMGNVSLDAKLTKYANSKAAKQAQQNALIHGNVFQEIDQLGFWLQTENLAMVGKAKVPTADQLAKELVNNLFYADQGHREALLNPHMKKVGIGYKEIFRDGRHQYWQAQDYGTKGTSYFTRIKKMKKQLQKLKGAKRHKHIKKINKLTNQYNTAEQWNVRKPIVNRTGLDGANHSFNN